MPQSQRDGYGHSPGGDDGARQRHLKRNAYLAVRREAPHAVVSRRPGSEAVLIHRRLNLVEDEADSMPLLQEHREGVGPHVAVVDAPAGELEIDRLRGDGLRRDYDNFLLDAEGCARGQRSEAPHRTRKTPERIARLTWSNEAPALSRARWRCRESPRCTRSGPFGTRATPRDNRARRAPSARGAPGPAGSSRRRCRAP